LKNKILINAISSLIQVVIVTLVYFGLYKYLLIKIGIEKLGIWSLILASTSILNVSNLGFASSVIKYVAKYKALHESQKIINIIQTSLITVSIFSGILIILLLPFASLILKLIVPSNYLILSQSVFPYSLLCLWINIQSGIFAATLDGFQRIDIKNIILTSSSIIYLFLSILLVPIYGLFGVVYAQVLQVSLSFMFNLILVKRIFPEYPIIKYHWNKATFKEIFQYSIKFQGITITQLMYDPITKSLLTKFGGLAATGYYEMASRLIQRVRSLIISANQVLVPTYATIHEESTENVKSLYLRNLNYVHFLTAPIFLFVIAIAPLISLIWIGHYEKYFVNSLIVLTIAWGINIYSAPAYFANLGIGELNWNLFSHIIIGLINLVLGILMGYFGGAMFVVYSWCIALIIGSLIVPISFHHRTELNFSILRNKENFTLITWNILAVLVSWFLFFYLESRTNIFYLSISILFGYFLINIYFLWQHSVRLDLTNQIKNLLRLRQE
jgi:O-antigen/teichoic acid export membrane protein